MDYCTVIMCKISLECMPVNTILFFVFNIVWIPNLPQPVKGEEGGASLSLSGKRDRGVW